MTRTTCFWCFMLLAAFTLSPHRSARAENSVAGDCLTSMKAKALPQYASSLLDETQRMLASFQHNSIHTKNEEESLHELIRVVKTTQSSYHAVNFYVFGWNSALELLYRTNVAAVKRGVLVTRTFILSDDILQDSVIFENLLTIMETQSMDGIKVYYGLHRELVKDARYKLYPMIDAGLSDGKVLAQVKAVSLYGPQPSYVDITWDRVRLKKKNPFPFLKNNPRIYSYNEKARIKLRGLVRKPWPPQ